MPLVTNNTFTVAEDSFDNIFDVLADDSDMDGDTLVISAIGEPSAGGTAVFNSNVITYTPTLNFFGTETFTYTASDGQGGEGTALVTVIVNQVNDDPIAADDSAMTDEDTAVIINVLANDSDADGDPLTVESVTQPTNGVVVNNGTDVTYTPNTNFFGSDNFDYTVSDNNGGTANATVTITVNEVPNVDTVVVKLLDSSGSGLAGGKVQYFSGGWQDIPGSTDTNGELVTDLPTTMGNLNFRMSYAGAAVTTKQDVSANPVVTFQTTHVTIQLLDSSGNPLDTGSVAYNAGGWQTIGDTTGGEVSRNCCPGFTTSAWATLAQR
ncbi:MAG: cadherin-like domain-containing protein [Chloroflexota bacterium]